MSSRLRNKYLAYLLIPQKKLLADVPAEHQGMGNYSLHLYVTEQCPQKSKLHTLSNIRSMVWCGVVWYGMGWCGVVWYGVVWCCMVWYGNMHSFSVS